MIRHSPHVSEARFDCRLRQRTLRLETMEAEHDPRDSLRAERPGRRAGGQLSIRPIALALRRPEAVLEACNAPGEIID